MQQLGHYYLTLLLRWPFLQAEDNNVTERNNVRLK